MNERLGMLRAYAAIRQTPAGLLLLAIAVVVGTIFSSVVVTDMGLIMLAIPVPLLLLVPVLAGVGVGMLMVEDARLPLPDPARAIRARLVWALIATAGGLVASLLGSLLSDFADPVAIARNLLFHAGLAFLCARGDGRLIAVPSLLHTLAAMLFGQGSHGLEVAPWAFTLDPRATFWSVGVALAVYLVGLAAVTWPRPNRLPGGSTNEWEQKGEVIP